MSEKKVRFSVKKLAEKNDPFGVCVWEGIESPITRKEVENAISEGRLLSDVYLCMPWRRERHAERIAWFVVNGFKDPIEVDVGVPELNCHPGWVIFDGNHRFAAAVFRNDEGIDVLPSGSVTEISRFRV